MPADPEKKKLKPCPRCGKDMPIGGQCADEACGFDEEEVHHLPARHAYRLEQSYLLRPLYH